MGKSVDLKNKACQTGMHPQDLLSQYIEVITKNLAWHQGIKVGGHIKNNLRCADASALIAENKGNLENLLTLLR